MYYVVGGGHVSVHWGPFTQRIPVSEIQSIVHGRGEHRPQINGINWFGCHVGRGETAGVGPVLFYSTHRVPEEIVYVRTATVAYGVSPQDPARFISQVERVKRSPPPAEPDLPALSRDFPAAHPIWADRVAQWLALAAVLLNVALWGFICAVYPDLSAEITIEFPPIGEVTTLHEKNEILKIPATATAFLALNLGAALLFQARERAATYLILSGTIFFQVVFWVAAIVAVVNA
jgi:hypothetical protein